MSEIKVGEIITGEAARDAIHVAVAPVVAEEPMQPGAHIGFYSNGTVGEHAPKLIGVVDPFLPKGTWTRVGQKFWMFLYPKTVANLRHDWSHPDFDVKPPVDSRKWLEEYAASHSTERFHLNYDILMAAVKKHLADPEYPDTAEGTLDDDYADWTTPPEFWEHYKAVTGVQGQGSFWGCCI